MLDDRVEGRLATVVRVALEVLGGDELDQVTTGRRTEFKPIPLSRVVRVELRKMFDTRSGFWLIASIGITGLIATIATIGRITVIGKPTAFAKL